MRHLGPATDLSRLRAAAAAEGRSVRLVTGGDDRRSTFAAFSAGLALPSWFGHNLDALVDALRELDDEEGRPLEIVWDGAGRLRAADRASYTAICAALADVERERGDLHVTVVDR